jgi:hypothetical protein
LPKFFDSHFNMLQMGEIHKDERVFTPDGKVKYNIKSYEIDV